MIEKEQLKFYKKNTIILNERFNFWNLKLAPIRLKLPIQLMVNADEAKELAKWKLTGLHNRLILMPWDLTMSILREFTHWAIIVKKNIKGNRFR